MSGRPNQGLELMRAQTSALRLVNDSTFEGKNRWSWSTWIEGTRAALDEINEVQYVLHPTFRNPVHIISSRSDNFRLYGSAWGEFNVFAEVRKTNGDTIELNHWLKFESPEADDEPKEKQPKVVISHGLADGPIANSLAHELIERGMNVTAQAQLPTGNAYDNELRPTLEAADVNVVLTTGIVADFSESDAVETFRVFETVKRPYVPIIVGGEDKLPSILKNKRVFRMSKPNRSEIVSIADGIQRIVDVDVA